MEKKTKKLEWKIGSIILIIIFGLFLWLIVSYFYVGSPKEILSVADQFKPKPEWQLTQNSVEPPRNSCIDIVCPSVARAWNLPQNLNREQFEQIAQIGQTKLPIANGCFEQYSDGHASKICTAVGTINGYYVELTYYGSTSEDKPSIVLSIKEEN